MAAALMEKTRLATCWWAAVRWLGWTGVYGCVPLLALAVFHWLDESRVAGIGEMFERGDALLIAVAFFASVLEMLQGIPRPYRPALTDVLMWVTMLAAFCSALLFGYAWPIALTAPTFQKELLGDISILVLALSVVLGVTSRWIAEGIAYDLLQAAGEVAK